MSPQEYLRSKLPWVEDGTAFYIDTKVFDLFEAKHMGNSWLWIEELLPRGETSTTRELVPSVPHLMHISQVVLAIELKRRLWGRYAE